MKKNFSCKKRCSNLIPSIIEKRVESAKKRNVYKSWNPVKLFAIQNRLQRILQVVQINIVWRSDKRQAFVLVAVLNVFWG